MSSILNTSASSPQRESQPTGAYGPTVLDGMEVTHTLQQAGEVQLHCVEAGPADGPLVLLLHGFPECWWSWHRQIAPLARAGFHVVAPDQRGYGTSDKPEGVEAYLLDVLASDITALADTLGYRSFQVVGHDWGGMVAWWTAIRFPDRVEKLTILNAPHPSVFASYAVRSVTQLLRSSYIAFFQLPWLPEAVLRSRNFRSLVKTMVQTSRLGAFTSGDIAIYRQAWAQPGALTAMLNWYRALPRNQHGQERVPVPALVLWGTQDAALERGLAEESLALCDQGRLQWFETATHWVQHEQFGAVNAALLGFLQK